MGAHGRPDRRFAAPVSDAPSIRSSRWSTLATRLLLVALVGATIGCDRVTKHMAATMLAGAAPRTFLNGSVRLQYAENTGGFLGIGATLPEGARTAIFTLGTGVAMAGLLVLAVRLRRRTWACLGLSLFVAGGLSNWIDRVETGRVIDFMVIGLGPVRTGIFNVADMAVMLGAALFVIAEFRHRPDPVPAEISPDGNQTGH